ncbi:hypothetical protein PY365_23840 [Roseiarcaceae bacterium H3SJ34-1]|uniref:hypothetical protein n=1 Tax=Terripilifer ovatus TaxID=3032367 RepID=UPI003AB93D8C|nr:hypothetical protein [Roseiarcaceae bacterium H3SJ34-1]
MLVVTGHHNAPALPALARSGLLARAISSKGQMIRPELSRAVKYATAKHCQNCPVQNLSLCNSLQHDELAELNSFVTDSHYKNHDILFDQDTPAKCTSVRFIFLE